MTHARVQPATSLRDLLRSVTAGDHDALDRALAPPGGRWTRERYVGFLQGTLSVVSAVEPAVAAALPERAPRGEATRVSRLRRDLAAFGVDVVAPPSAAFGAMPGSAAAAYGIAYVLEGSQLGGRVIAAQIAGALGLENEGLAYLRPPGAPAGSRWKAFVARLEAFGEVAPEGDRDVAATWASRTFAAFATAFRREGLI